MTTTDQAHNGADTTTPFTTPTPKSGSSSQTKARAKDQPGERTVTLDLDVADELGRLAKKHDRRIRDIVRALTINADDQLGEPEVKPDGVTWAERMARRNH